MAANAHPTSSTTTTPSNEKTMITIPSSGASYPAFLEPLTPNEMSLLKMYDMIKQHEREAAHIKAEEAKRRLEEADERYRAKVRERNNNNNNNNNMQGTNTADAKKTDRSKQKSNDDHNPHQIMNDGEEQADDDDDGDFSHSANNERKRKREIELSQLRQDVSAAKEAKRQKEEAKQQAKRKAEEMRRELLGETNNTTTTGEKSIAAVAYDNNIYESDDDHDDDDELDHLNDFDAFEDAKVAHRKQSSSSVPTIKKKQRTLPSSQDGTTTMTTTAPGNHPTRQQTSLIANIIHTEGSITPIHDFSKRLDMRDDNNSSSTSKGSIIFPIPGDDNLRAPWSPPEAPTDFIDGCLELLLPDLDPSFSTTTTTSSSSPDAAGAGNNTLAIKFQAPQESQRFSINIATSSNNNTKNQRYDDILFHFNPRQCQKGGQLVMNDRKESRWGNDMSIPLSTIPLIFGAKNGSTLIVQIHSEGFDVYVEGVHCARLEHRSKLPEGENDGAAEGGGGRRRLPSLVLQFPSSNDYGDPENWRVHRVWWGRKPPMFDEGALDRIPGVKMASGSVHPRRLFVSGLPRVSTDPEVDLRRAELERAFRKYGGPTGAVAVSVQKNSAFAFVDVASEELADLAVAEMAGNNGQYRVNKARRTRHEALMEERAAREKKEAEGGDDVTKETAGWD